MEQDSLRILSVLLILFANQVGSQKSQEDAPLRYVRGVYELPEAPNAIPVIYDAYFPIMFEFNLPTWDVNSMKIQFWKDHNNCTESDNYADGYPCPVMHHMNFLIENFVGNMTSWRNLFLDDPLPEEIDIADSEENLDLDLPLIFTRNNSLILDQEYYCSKIVPHFSNFQTTREKLKEYYRLIDKCENDIVKVRINLNTTAIKLEELYHQTFSSFVTDYWDKLQQISKQASSLNMWATLETSLLLHQFMETQKWTKAIDSCQQGQIPWTVIDHDAITDAIRSNLHVSDHQLAIPLTEMSKYFKLPLTDCVFVGKDTFIVRILIPYRFHAKETEKMSRIKSPYKIIKFEPIIFHKDGEFCWIDDIRDKRFIADSANPGNLFITECSDSQEQKLCRIPLNHYSSHDAADPCAQALYSDVFEEIVDSCSLKCLPSEKRHYNYKYFNFAHTTDDNFIYSLADDEMGIKIKCQGQDPIQVRKLDYGAWNLTLPCACEVNGAPAIDFEIAAPCHDKFIMEKIRPYHWKEEIIKKNKPKEEEERSSSAIKSEEDFIRALDKRLSSYTLHYVLLWIIILILGVVVGVLCYFVMQLRQWRQHEVFKESRLIYSNIMDNREEFGMQTQNANI